MNTTRIELFDNFYLDGPFYQDYLNFEEALEKNNYDFVIKYLENLSVVGQKIVAGKKRKYKVPMNDLIDKINQLILLINNSRCWSELCPSLSECDTINSNYIKKEKCPAGCFCNWAHNNTQDIQKIYTFNKNRIDLLKKALYIVHEKYKVSNLEMSFKERHTNKITPIDIPQIYDKITEFYW